MAFPLKILLVLCERSLNPLRKGGGGVTFTFWVGMCRWDPETFSLYQTYNLGQKSWDTFAFLRRFAIHTSPSPSPHPTNNVGRVYSVFFLSFNFVQGGGRENCKTVSKRMHCFKREQRNDRKIRTLQYCPKDKLYVCRLFFTGNVSNGIPF